MGIGIVLYFSNVRVLIVKKAHWNGRLTISDYVFIKKKLRAIAFNLRTGEWRTGTIRKLMNLLINVLS